VAFSGEIGPLTLSELSWREAPWREDMPSTANFSMHRSVRSGFLSDFSSLAHNHGEIKSHIGLKTSEKALADSGLALKSSNHFVGRSGFLVDVQTLVYCAAFPPVSPKACSSCD
jgi:hypothetical protein